jgi:transposase-like protein
MKKSKFSEEQIVRILKEVEAGAKVAETCRKHGISDANVLRLKKQIRWHGSAAATVSPSRKVHPDITRGLRAN